MTYFFEKIYVIKTNVFLDLMRRLPSLISPVADKLEKRKIFTNFDVNYSVFEE